MSLLKALLLCALVGYAAAITVRSCSDSRAPNPLRVEFSGCPHDVPPCSVEDGSEYDMSITFKPRFYAFSLKSKLTASIGSGFFKNTLDIDTSYYRVCDNIYTLDGSKASCPLYSSGTYKYKLHFTAYIPWFAKYIGSVNYIRLALKDEDNYEVVCFEFPNVKLT